MTAQIAIMNKSAVAMASDSAVTITARSDNKSKIYNTVNKLFTLSKYAPVGVMIFGNSEFLQTPWETIIKLYREKLRTKTFKSIDDYANHLIEFLYKSNDLFPADIRNEDLEINSAVCLYSLLHDIDDASKNYIKNIGQVTETEVKNIIKKTISTHLSFIRSASFLRHIDVSTPKKILKNHRSKFYSQIDDIFQKLPLSDLQKQRLIWICSNYPCRDLFDENQSGIVIAGFGDDDVFPHLRSFVFQSNYRELIKYKPDKTGDISQNSSAAIYPFAQSDMVGEFMEGCHPAQSNFIVQYIKNILSELPKHITNKIENCSQAERNEFISQFSEFSGGLVESFIDDLKKFRRKEHINPVIDTVGSLPKDELATMAEALVNLTQFRQRMTMDMETVGGPIDVAVISKGDGFIWINRKHYFKAELNQHFMMKYFPDETQEDSHE